MISLCGDEGEDNKVPRGYHIDPKVIAFFLKNLPSMAQHQTAMEKQGFKKDFCREAKKNALEVKFQMFEMAEKNVATH